MAVFKELDPQLHLKLVEGYTDALTPEAKKNEAFYQLNRKCKRCGDPLQKEYPGVSSAWTGDGLIAKMLLRCPNCRFCIEPFTGLILDTGDASKIPMPMYPESKI